MARKRIPAGQPLPTNEKLAQRLGEELRSAQESGQPLIYETELAPDRFRVLVVWDAWDGVPLDERTRAILRAYELAEGPTSRSRIALASGLTVPEATEAGMLTYQISTALRRGDPVTFQQCWDAMLAEGASHLFGPDVLQLRFATHEEAEACRQRLIRRLPNSEDVWLVNREIIVQDFASFRDLGQVHQ